MQDRYIAAVDFGSSKIALSVAKVEGNDIQIHYYKELPSAGISRGAIKNPSKAAGVLKTLIDDANEELGIKILQVVVSLPRYRVDQEQDTATVTRTDADTPISEKEIADITDLAVNEYKFEDPDNRIIYGAVPQSFSVDDQSMISESDVIGVYSESIEGHFTFFIGQKKPMDNITFTLNMVGVAPANKIFAPAATASAVLSEDEKERGVALVEIGSNITSVTIYKGKRLKYYGSIPFGGKTISLDLQDECRLNNFNLAESIKKAYGSCTPNNLLTLSEKVLQINDEETGEHDRITIKYISEIIEERCKEIIEAVLYLIQDSGFHQDLRKGVVLTGGGSKLSGIKTLFSEMSGYDVRLGYPKTKKFWVEDTPAATELSASATMGMILRAAKDENLNCIQSIKLEEEEVISPEFEVKNNTLKDKEATNKEQHNGELFDKEYVVQPNPKEGKKAEHKPIIHWDKLLKVANKIGVGVDKHYTSLIEGLYDEMDKNENGQ